MNNDIAFFFQSSGIESLDVDVRIGRITDIYIYERLNHENDESLI